MGVTWKIATSGCEFGCPFRVLIYDNSARYEYDENTLQLFDKSTSKKTYSS